MGATSPSDTPPSKACALTSHLSYPYLPPTSYLLPKIPGSRTTIKLKPPILLCLEVLRMSNLTVANLPRLSSTALSQIILEHSTSNLDASTAPSHIAIIDVRDDDHIGGHIKHSTHVPSQTLDRKVPELVRELKDKEIVIFHCALSQQRGPKAALRYVRERETLLGAEEKTVGGILKKNAEVRGDREGEEAWEDVKQKEQKEQKVYVLDRGFVGWQEKFGENSQLTEGYRKELWKDGYWM